MTDKSYPRTSCPKCGKKYLQYNYKFTPRCNCVVKPQRPIGRRVYESDSRSGTGNFRKCPYCKSSLKRKMFFSREKHCIQPECINYKK